MRNDDRISCFSAARKAIYVRIITVIQIVHTEFIHCCRSYGCLEYILYKVTFNTFPHLIYIPGTLFCDVYKASRLQTGIVLEITGCVCVFVDVVSV